MQSGNEIVEAVTFVIETRATLTGNFGQQRRQEYPLAAVIHFRHVGHHFQRIQCPTRIAVDQLSDGSAGIIGQNDILSTVPRALSSIA